MLSVSKLAGWNHGVSMVASPTLMILEAFTGPFGHRAYVCLRSALSCESKPNPRKLGCRWSCLLPVALRFRSVKRLFCFELEPVGAFSYAKAWKSWDAQRVYSVEKKARTRTLQFATIGSLMSLS